MITFKQFLEESKLERVFHGTKYNTTSINPAHMDNSINEYGVGIYFTTNIKTASTYGANIIETMVNPARFINSTQPVSKAGSGYLSLLLELKKTAAEGMYYYVTDFGMEVSEPEDITDAHIRQLYNKIKPQQLRHSQQEIVDNVGVEKFVAAWNKTMNYDGLKEPKPAGEMFYVIINPKLKVTPVKRDDK